MNKELKQELKEIEKQIKTLEKRKSQIEKELIKGADNFLDKFRIWWESDEGEEEGSILNSKKFPKLRALIDEGNFNRYATVSLEDLVGYDNFFLFTEDKSINVPECVSEEEYQEIIKAYTPALEEAMKKNVKSYVHDW